MTLTSAAIALLEAGKPIRAPLHPERQDHNRWIVVYPANARSPGPPRFSVIVYEVEARLDLPLEIGRDKSVDFDVSYVLGLVGLEAALDQMADQIGPFAELVRSRLVVRNEPGNWLIEMDGRLIASAADRPRALGFVCAAAQHFYEFDGIIPIISSLEDGVERILHWEPDHDFLNAPDE